jgi:hypothetical protein
MKERNKKATIGELIRDYFADTWKLLSDTTVFLGRTPEFHQYEAQLRQWRAQLQNAKRSQEKAREIRVLVTALRKDLRLQGYDLGTGAQSLTFDGFRDDACIAQGFRRVVLFLAEDDIYWLAGDENHLSLGEYLEKQLASGTLAPAGVRIRSKHYLWYKRDGGSLILCGSATELAADFARLCAIGEANTLLFLSKLKKLR